MKIIKKLKKINYTLNLLFNEMANSERHDLTMGRLLSELIIYKKNIKTLQEVEFKIFSQFGDDGIIQWLINNLDIPNKTFIEFGVENYIESNTRFLMMNNNWSGFVMDGSPNNIENIRNSFYYWKYELYTKAVFIDMENIDKLLTDVNFNPEVGILHIDLDGNDYWIWKAIVSIKPIIVILEYNSVFGIDRPITVPYDKSFIRTEKHYSNLYFGSSLRALYELSKSKGYAFIGCNSAGNNAYFVREDKTNSIVKDIPLNDGYVISKYRESRNKEGLLNYLTGNDRLNEIKNMPVYNVNTDKIESL